MNTIPLLLLLLIGALVVYIILLHLTVGDLRKEVTILKAELQAEKKQYLESVQRLNGLVKYTPGMSIALDEAVGKNIGINAQVDRLLEAAKAEHYHRGIVRYREELKKNG